MIDFYDPACPIPLEPFTGLCKVKDFNSLAVYLWDIEHEGLELPPNLLILKAEVIQLSESSNYTLKDVEESLLRAIQIEPTNLEAYIELGYFYYAVMDQPEKAILLFEDAEKFAEKFLLSAILGKAKVLVDLNKTDEAKWFLNNSHFATHSLNSVSFE